MIVIGLFMGGNVLTEIPNSSPDKLFALQVHMSMGSIILVLMIIRLVVRFRSAKPPHADLGNDLLNKAGIAAHYAFYVIVFAVCASGIGISIAAGLPDIVFGGSGAPLPATFDDLAPRAAHGIVTKLLGLLIIAHIAAFLFHQFVKRDGLFSRMWYGKRD